MIDSEWIEAVRVRLTEILPDVWDVRAIVHEGSPLIEFDTVGFKWRCHAPDKPRTAGVWFETSYARRKTPRQLARQIANSFKPMREGRYVQEPILS